MLAAILRDQLSRPDGDSDLLQFESVWHSRAWVRERAEALTALIGSLGLPEGAPIGFAPRCRPEWAAALMGLIAAERPINMVHAYLSPAATAVKLRDLRLPVLIASEEQWDAESLAAAAECGTAAIRLKRGGANAELLMPFATTAHDRWKGAPGIAFLSSGTTGEPKPFAMGYDRIFERMVKATAYVADPDAKPMLAFYPPSNISGIYTILPVLAAGQRLVMLEKFAPEAWAHFVEIWRPKTVGLPVAALAMILEAEIEPDRIASLEQVSSGASSLPPALRRAFEARYGIPVLEAYGATEFGGVVTAMSAADRAHFGEAKAASAGRPLPGFALRVTDPDSGAPLSSGCEGRLEVRTPGGDHWVRTTDLALIDAEGFLYCRGRLDGVISRGGFKLVPEEIAAAILSHPEATGAAVVGLPDPRLGETPAALIEVAAASKLDARGMEIHLRARLPAPAIPALMMFTHALPRTVSLKPDLGAARRLLSAASA